MAESSSGSPRYEGPAKWNDDKKEVKIIVEADREDVAWVSARIYEDVDRGLIIKNTSTVIKGEHSLVIDTTITAAFISPLVTTAMELLFSDVQKRINQKKQAQGKIMTTVGAEPLSQELNKEELIDLLRNGKVDEFNGIRRKYKNKILDLQHANLSDTNLSWANLSDANLSNIILADANLSNASLSNAILSRANLSGATLSGAILHRATLSDANLSGADLSNANLSYDNLALANLSYAILSVANLSGADLSNANLSSAILSRANLTGANLSSAKLTSVDLTGANLPYADLSNANVSNANLSNANLSNVKINDRTNFENAKLTSAYPSSFVTDITTRTMGKESK